MSEKKPTIELRVTEAKQRDVIRGKVRLDNSAMKKLGITTGEIIEISAKKVTAAVAWPAYKDDIGQGIIRMDGVIRQNSGVSIGDRVTVSKAKVSKARNVNFHPANMNIPVDFGFENFVKRKLVGFPFSKGDVVMIPVLGRAIPFVVSKMQPPGIILVTEETQVSVSSKPMDDSDIGRPSISYEDIGGLKDEITRVREMVELPLRHPELFDKLGIDPPSGVLLHGPPGCGKTLIARAVASESDAHFITIQGPEIMSKYYGESEQRLRAIFREAQDKSPSIIFIDELDAIAPKREDVSGEVERRVVAQLLALMDGITSRGQVIVIGATNRPNAVDPALRRPGRFDREIEIDVPNRTGRLEVLHIHTRGMPLAKDVILEKLADVTHGFVGADLQALAREAAMKTLRSILPEIDLELDVIPSEILETLEVSHDDFQGALKEVQPTAIREVFIEIPNVNYDDVGGLKEVIASLKEAVEWPIKSPERFLKLGISPPKGVLLYGPPGTGKTLIAKAVASESEANFISIKGPELLSKWVGESEKAIREVFRKARLAAPCIIFFDEIDSMAPRRGSSSDNPVTERVISQFLTEIDGMELLKDVMILAATNRPDLIDSALLRPGRFDRLIKIEEPDLKAREEILKIYVKDMPLADDVDIVKIASTMDFYVGADIEALCREAAIAALREDNDASVVKFKHFEEAKTIVHPTMNKQLKKFYDQVNQTLKTRRNVEAEIDSSFI
ncbi:MAG: CDC48 family AAA ATPase [Candidatus Kariarchaeaceae archaeon]